MTKLMLGNFLDAHIDRVDGADESTREKFWTMLINYYMIIYSYKCMSLPCISISHKKLADTNLKQNACRLGYHSGAISRVHPVCRIKHPPLKASSSTTATTMLLAVRL